MSERGRNLRLLRILYLIVVATLVGWLIVRRRTEIGGLLDGTRIGWLLVSLVLSFGMIGWAAVVWRHLLRAQGELLPYPTVLHATGRAVLARYVPGSIWFAVGRATLLARAGAAATPLAVTAAVDVALSIAIAITGGALILGIGDDVPGGVAWAVVAAAGLVALASPTVGGRAISWLAVRRGVTVEPLGWADYLTTLGLIAMFWAWSALTFSTYLRAFPAADGFDPPTIAGGFLFAWGVGFLAIFAPQGLGVFEVTLATILVNQGIGETALVIGGYRVVILVRDVIATSLAEATAGRSAMSDSGADGRGSDETG